MEQSGPLFCTGKGYEVTFPTGFPSGAGIARGSAIFPVMETLLSLMVVFSEFTFPPPQQLSVLQSGISPQPFWARDWSGYKDNVFSSTVHFWEQFGNFAYEPKAILSVVQRNSSAYPGGVLCSQHTCLNSYIHYSISLRIQQIHVWIMSGLECQGFPPTPSLAKKQKQNHLFICVGLLSVEAFVSAKPLPTHLNWIKAAGKGGKGVVTATAWHLSVWHHR